MKTSKKAFLLVAMLMLCTMATNARDNIIVEGSFAKLQTVNKFNIDIDWSNIHVNGLNLSEWIRFRNNEQPSYDAEDEYQHELKPTWVKMVDSANDKLNSKQIFLLPNSPEQDYTIIVSPHQIDRKGNLEAFCSIINRNDEVLVKFVLTGKGGMFGTMSNLWGDGFKSAGKNLAKILQKYLHK